LKLFALLLESYEKAAFPVVNPSALEAIRFRMDEQNLSPRDLEPFIGSRSKVSEVLSGKVSLSLRMIRELNRGLGIPLEVLVQGSSEQSVDQIDWERVPITEMVRLGWIQGGGRPSKNSRLAMAQMFFKDLQDSPAGALLRRTARTRSAVSFEREAVAAWLIEANRRSKSQVANRKFRAELLDAAFLKKVAETSADPGGVLAVRSVLANVGVVLVVVPHLSGTRLDGAAFVRSDERAVVALTLRHDRLDSFWFTLLHELVHLARHSKVAPAFVDDLDLVVGDDPLEIEADAFARDAIIPHEAWVRSAASRERNARAVMSLAAQLRIHPALVAGRLRFETKNYRLLNNLVGRGQVRHVFAREFPTAG
jgi:HTH-type transcriptional regulator/antitoxin HigA